MSDVILLRLPEVARRTGRSRSAIYRDMAAGAFPRPVQTGARSVAWRSSDVAGWIEARPVSAVPVPTRAAPEVSQ